MSRAPGWRPSSTAVGVFWVCYLVGVLVLAADLLRAVL